MLDLAKEAKRLGDYIKYTMPPNDRLIEVDVCHAKEMLDRAIVAEKALELMADYISISEMCHDCQFHVGKDSCDGFTGRRACGEVIADWFVEKAREKE